MTSWTQTRYTKCETWTVNGLETERFETDELGYGPLCEQIDCGAGTHIDCGIRVWFRKEEGSETEVTSGVSAIAHFDEDHDTPQTIYYTPPRRYFGASDAIVARWYYRPEGGSWSLLKSFITEQLLSTAQNTLEATQWSVYHAGYWYPYWGGYPPVNAFWQWYYGDYGGCNIQNIKFYDQHLTDIADSGSGTETQAYSALVKDPVTDAGAGAEQYLGPIWATEEGIGADVYLRLMGLVRLNDFDLPHVRAIKIRGESTKVTVPVLDLLPRRRIIGIKGRKIDITGFATYDEIQTLRSLRDGSRALLSLPDGETMAVILIDVSPRKPVRRPDVQDYAVRLQEMK